MSDALYVKPVDPERPEIFGHPAGLFTLFFAEMWERFSYYGMRALLIFYMTKGFLGYGDKRAYAVYGAYTALVYATPFIGGMLADRLLGSRKAVVLGGMLMAAGHLLMTWQSDIGFFGALALLIVGNGFFKPNISTMVGGLYPKGSPKRDSGFTIFYMGINLGAALAPLLCGYVGETFGWHYGFGLATIGMLIGLAVFVAPRGLTMALIVLGALAAAGSMVWFGWSDKFMLSVNAPVAVALIISAFVAAAAVGKGGLPDDVGRAPASAANNPAGQWMVYGGVLVAVPAIAFMVYRSGIASIVLSVFGVIALGIILFEAFRGTKIERERLFVVLTMMFFSMLFWAFFEQAGSSVNNFTDRNVDRSRVVAEASRTISASDAGQTITFEPTQAQLGYPMPAGPGLIKAPIEGTISKVFVESGADVAEASEMIAIVAKDDGKEKTFTLNSLDAASTGGAIAWSDNIIAGTAVTADQDLGTIDGVRLFTIDRLDELRTSAREAADAAKDAAPDSPADPNAPRPATVDPKPSVTWTLQPEHAGMTIGGKETPASVFQAVNPICILTFGLAFSALWGFLGKRKMEPSTAVKFGFGLFQLGLGFAAFWWGAQQSDSRGMTSMIWLILGYTLHTTGELCLSPVGLSMVTRLSPVRIVSTVMGGWFLATAFSNLLAAVIAQLTGGEHGDGDAGTLPPPIESVNVYGDVFGQIAIYACAAAVLVWLLSPILKKWEHREVADDGAVAPPGH